MIIHIKSPRRFRLKQEQEQKDRFVEKWSTQFLIDEIYLSLMNVKEKFCMLGPSKEARMDDLRNLGLGVNRRLYEEQARYRMYRMPIHRPPPVFVIHLKNLDDKIREELSTLDKELLKFVLQQVAERIFEHVDERYFLLSVKPFLKVRLEK